MRIAYFVHDLSDAAVRRRVIMLRTGGAEVVVLGFSRTREVPETLADAPVVCLGLTRDAAMLQRGLAVLGNLINPKQMLAHVRDPDILIGRNLEALALARRCQKAWPNAALVYECLDIHRLLLSNSLPARAIQSVESLLLKAVDLLITSSPAYEREYFSKRQALQARSLLLENKLLELHASADRICAVKAEPPWTIGWFGMLRCARTFRTLADLAARSNGKIEVQIAGRPSAAVFPDFDAMVAASPGLHYQGPYRPNQLGTLYGRCHFAWAIDWFEEGLNSKWLLPNRLYEAASFGVVPIALKSVETGRWLDRHGVGVTVSDDLGELEPFFADLDSPSLDALRASIMEIPSADLVADRSDCAALIAALRAAREAAQ